MALTIHGSARSRTLRVLWMAEELGLAYDHDPVAFDDPRLKSPAFLQLNPAGAIPTIEDDGFALAEFLAINLYLAKNHTPRRRSIPATLEGEAQAWRWSLWAQGQLEPWIMGDALLADLHAAAAPHAAPVVAAALATLERALADRDWLVGGAFTVADLNVAAVLSPSRSGRLDLSPYPRVAAWLARCHARRGAVAGRAISRLISAPMNRRPVPFDLGPVHFVGIGGIGMSGIAEIMLRIGYAGAGLRRPRLGQHRAAGEAGRQGLHRPRRGAHRGRLGGGLSPRAVKAGQSGAGRRPRARASRWCAAPRCWPS